jgi:hypothetical protein
MSDLLVDLREQGARATPFGCRRIASPTPHMHDERHLRKSTPLAVYFAMRQRANCRTNAPVHFEYYFVLSALSLLDPF